MPADLSITSAGNSAADSFVAPVRDTQATTATPAVSSQSAPVTPVAPPSGVPGPNPTRYFDHASGIVVLQFVSANGTVDQTIPTAKQLEAFRYSQAAATKPVDTTAAASPASIPKTGGGDAVHISVPTTASAVPVPVPAPAPPAPHKASTAG